MERKLAHKQNRVEKNLSRRATKGSFVMGAHIIELAEFRARRSESGEAAHAKNEPASGANRFHFWTGASGKRYVHTVYNLLECPALPAGNYVLVRRGQNGRHTVLAISRHLLANTAKQSKLVEFDLRGSQIKPDVEYIASSSLVH
jgi:hypothetical protein